MFYSVFKGGTINQSDTTTLFLLSIHPFFKHDYDGSPPNMHVWGGKPNQKNIQTPHRKAQEGPSIFTPL